jgi:hypothetical protein
MAYVHRHFVEPKNESPFKSLHTPLDTELEVFKATVLDQAARYEQMYLPFNETSKRAPGWRR